MKKYLQVFKHLILLPFFISLGLFLVACGGGGGGGSVTPADVTGTWSVYEDINNTQCGGSGDTDQYTVTISQSGSSISVVTNDGTFSGTVTGNSLSWTGQYYDNYDGLWITITSSSLTISGDTFTGTAYWEARNTQNGTLLCSGSTVVSGTRTGGGSSVAPDAPTGLSVTSYTSSSISLSWSDNSNNESSFLIERAIGSPNNFSQIGNVTTNVTSYTDMNLNASTTYYYQVRASNAYGNSAYSGMVQATTSAASQTLPAAPAGLSATALSASSIRLNWTDMATNESGYRIERGLNTNSYSQVAQIAANSTTYTDSSGLQASTPYYYRVLAYNNAGPSIAATANATTQSAVVNYTLTVNKSGTGSGTVTGTGINCGSDCTHVATSGTSIVLSAVASSGSTFVSWSGCTSTSGSNCTVSLGSNMTVTAIFNTVISTSITLSLPTTSTTGSYTLSWSVTGLAASNWPIQEDSDTSFSSPTSYLSYDTTVPYQYAFSNKANGTYCYRVSLASVWSAPVCITVARDTTATLRIINNTKYDMIDLRLNSVQKINYPYVILPSGSADYVFTSGGSVSVAWGVGFYNSSTTRDIWFLGTSNVTVTAGQTYTLTVNNPTLGNMLSGFSSSRSWDGVYYCYSCSTLVHTARFNFTSSGGWTFYDDGAYVGSGTATLVSWPNYASIITFRLCNTCENIQLNYPFGSFYYRNGPADWPIIEYIGR
ncbi:MAG: fibronectin type III domain-containing protein [Gammaproteobacteria bacterium]|nr:fibronectin type III domain-containing protein [Gammaproteobacteria bacterium]